MAFFDHTGKSRGTRAVPSRKDSGTVKELLSGPTEPHRCLSEFNTRCFGEKILCNTIKTQSKHNFLPTRAHLINAIDMCKEGERFPNGK